MATTKVECPAMWLRVPRLGRALSLLLSKSLSYHTGKLDYLVVKMILLLIVPTLPEKKRDQEIKFCKNRMPRKTFLINFEAPSLLWLCLCILASEDNLYCIVSDWRSSWFFLSLKYEIDLIPKSSTFFQPASINVCRKPVPLIKRIWSSNIQNRSAYTALASLSMSILSDWRKWLCNSRRR